MGTLFLMAGLVGIFGGDLPGPDRDRRLHQRGLGASASRWPSSRRSPRRRRRCARSSSRPSRSGSSPRCSTQSLGLGKKLTPADHTERIRHKLEVAGNPPGLDRRPRHLAEVRRLHRRARPRPRDHDAPRASASCRRWAACMLLSVAGYMAPNMYLYQKGYDRTAEDPAGAAGRHRPAHDLGRVRPRLRRRARPRWRATPTARSPRSSPACCRRCRSASAAVPRCARSATAPTSPEVKGFVSAMVQADALGIPVAQVLRVQSREIRTKRRQRAEEQAQKVADQDPDPADLLHPALSLHRGPRPRRHQHVRGVLGPDVTSQLDRLGLAARAFFLATVLGLALAFRSPEALQGTVLLAVIGGDGPRGRPLLRARARRGSSSSRASSPHWSISLTLPDGAMVLPYLVVPALLAGISGSMRAVGAGRRVRGGRAGPRPRPRWRRREHPRRPRARGALGGGQPGRRPGRRVVRADARRRLARRRGVVRVGPPAALASCARWPAGSPPGSTRCRMAEQVLAAVHERARRRAFGGLRADRGRRARPPRLPRVRREAGAHAERLPRRPVLVGDAPRPGPPAVRPRGDPLAHACSRSARAPG